MNKIINLNIKQPVIVEMILLKHQTNNNVHIIILGAFEEMQHPIKTILNNKWQIIYIFEKFYTIFYFIFYFFTKA